MPHEELEQIEVALVPYERARLLADQLPGDEVTKSDFNQAIRAFTRDGNVELLASATANLPLEAIPLVFQFLDRFVADYQATTCELLKAMAPNKRSAVFQAAKGVTEESFGEWAEVASSLQPEEILALFEVEIIQDLEDLLRSGCESIETDLNELGRTFEYDIEVPSISVDIDPDQGVEIEGAGQVRVWATLDVSVISYLDEEEEVAHSATLPGSAEAYYEGRRLHLESAFVDTNGFWGGEN